VSPPGRAALPSRSGVALLIACVLPVLWFGTVRPALTEARWPWPGHPAPFTLTSYLPGDCPFYRATIVSLLEDRDLDLRNNVDWAVLSPDTQVAIARTGAWVPKHPLGLSLAALPAYALFGDAGLLGFNLLQLLALDCLLLLAACQVASETVAFGVALLFALGSGAGADAVGDVRCRLGVARTGCVAVRRAPVAIYAAVDVGVCCARREGRQPRTHRNACP